jgi:hypothetical protein
MSQSSQLQPLLLPGDLADASDNTPSPPPQPGEQARNRRSQTARHSSGTDSEVCITRSTTRAGGGFHTPHCLDTPATHINSSRTVAPHQRTGLRLPTALAMASPNSYSLLGGEDEGLDAAADDSPPPGAPDHTAAAHGWDSFVNSLTATAKGELGTVDEILISYTNFASGEFRAFDVKSTKVMG